VEVASGSINKQEATTTEFPLDLLSVEVASGNINKKDGNLTGFEEALYKTVHGDWQFCKINGVFREAELIHLECYHLEIHLYQLFFRVGL
jgi:hypothetical protein